VSRSSRWRAARRGCRRARSCRARPTATARAPHPPAPLRTKETAPAAGEARERSLKDARDNFERAYILTELRTNDWNVTRTAERLGIERSHLYRKLKGYNINPPKRDA